MMREAVTKELSTLVSLGSIEIVDTPPGQHLVPMRWVLGYKYDNEGNFLKASARLTP